MTLKRRNNTVTLAPASIRNKDAPIPTTESINWR